MNKKPSKSLAEQFDRYITPFRHDGSGKFRLKAHKTDEKGGLDKEQGLEILEANKKRLIDFQEKLYAQDRWSVLIVLQGMDAGGKDPRSRRSSRASTRRVARFIRSSSRAARSSTTTSSGAMCSRCLSAAISASSTAPITRSAW